MAYEWLEAGPCRFAELASHYTRNEAAVLADAIGIAALSDMERTRISDRASDLVRRIRREMDRPVFMDALLQEYGLSTEEGVILMRLSEALIRTPDFSTSRKLVRDKLEGANWTTHAGRSASFVVNQATSGLRLSSAWIKASGGVAASNLAARLGDRVLTSAVERSMGLMGGHFVLGRTIREAVRKASQHSGERVTHSYDMLGEAAYTREDAEAYFSAYLGAAQHLAAQTDGRASVAEAPGLSVKLSALHPRYEYAQSEKCVPALTARLIELALIAKEAGFGLTVDAEEADRLETSLIIFRNLLTEPALADWDGLGIVVQAYQRRALPLLRWLIDETRAAGRAITVRLVKGAYWDMEIKRAQELGLESYPVFTRKENTDVSYLACARVLLDARNCLFAQFATHNAHTAAAIQHMAGRDEGFEFQRLHGMGEALHEVLLAQTGVGSRIYAPVGEHKDLLPYLVRRLLENGANSSFVNQLFDPEIKPDALAADPIEKAERNQTAANPHLRPPRDLFHGQRLSAYGIDVTQKEVAQEKQAAVKSGSPLHAASIVAGRETGDRPVDVVNPANSGDIIGAARTVGAECVSRAVESAARSGWRAGMTASERADCLFAAADRLEEEMDDFLRLCVLEAGKTLPDAIAEVREAVDFCRYYALEAQTPRIESRKPLGVVACISPWNFPLAIFLGQIVAALSVGDTVVAKPAQQTPLISYRAIKLLQASGAPADAVQLLLGDGAELGNALTRHPDIAGVCFTGSTATAKRIALNLAETGRSDTPLIAETGGVNAMIVDSTALPEQAVQDVVASAFQSAGQRCSACRLVCVQDDIADAFITMLSGAMRELTVGDPALLSTDVGPVIDARAHAMIGEYVTASRGAFDIVGQAPDHDGQQTGFFSTPVAFEVARVSDVKKEVFGPVLHVVRFSAGEIESVVEEINDLGYGLTMGLHTRLDDRVRRIADMAHVGNLYVNRNQIGAVVGVQPFGGEGLSGTGPKAGGPNYLLRLTQNHRTAPSGPPNTAMPAPPETIDVREANEAILQARRAAQQWAATATPAERTNHAKRALASAFAEAESNLPDVSVERSILLPGPTGETNRLTLCPRGALICFGADDAQTLIRQILLALSAGNGLLVALPPDAQPYLPQLNKLASALPYGIISIRPYTEAAGLIDAPVDGVISDGPVRAMIAEQVCRRAGPILPVLSAFDEPERFYHERTTTINTTAAGGNASLLAMS